MFFLVVNYHYIEEPGRYPFEGIYPISPTQLEKQIDLLSKHFIFISQDDLLGAVEGRKKFSVNCCLLTFDDGFKGQYENALPILNKKGVPAIFFVNSLPLRESKVCTVHKIHWLRANLEAQELLSKVDQALKKEAGKRLQAFNISEKEAISKYLYDTPEIAKLKFALNTAIPTTYREKVVKNIFTEIVGEESAFCKDFYMSKNNISELDKLSFLGTHADTHRPLAQLSEKELYKEIELGVNSLYELTGNKPKAISYPYGDSSNFSPKVAKMCEGFDLKLGFTTELAFNRTFKEPLLFARMDTNDVLAGKHQSFDFDGENIKILKEFNLSRKLYFKE